MRTLIEEIEQVADRLDGAAQDDLAVIKTRLRAGLAALSAAVDWIRSAGRQDVNTVLCGATPFLHLLGIVSGGWQMARAAAIAQNRLDAGANDPAFYRAKITTARFFADHSLSQAAGLAEMTMHGAPAVMALAEDQF
jgi:hypothetical protein